MKKLFLSAMAVVTMLFTACTSNDELVQNDEAGVQRIILAVENASGNATRAGRELLSSEAKQSIQNVKVIITKQSDNTIVYVKDYTDWNNTESTTYNAGGHGRQAEIVLSGSDKLAAGSYNIYAIGYHTGSQYTMGADVALATELAKYTKVASAPYNQFVPNTLLKANAVTAEEIFAGYNSMTVTGTGVKTTIVLHRQVAGVFAYVDEIPYIAGAAKLSLYASDNNTTLILGKFMPENGAELAANGTNTNNKVVNGYTASGTVTKIMSTNLSSWFSSIVADANNLIDATKWNADGSKYVSGSVFMGQFIVPFRRYDGRTTLVLKLEDSSDAELRAWNIKLPSGDVTAGNINYWDGSAWATTSTSATTSAYNIFRNHLYGIGTKATDGPSDPGNNDDPQTLNTKEDLVLKVNDNWEVIHTMEIE